MKMIINGKKVDASNKEAIKVINPANGQFIDDVPSATKDDIEAAVNYAKIGQKAWKKQSIYERSLVMGKFIEAVRKLRDDLAMSLCLETGKIILEAKAEIDVATDIFVNYIEKMKHWYSEVYPIGNDAGNKNHIHFSIREPIGVVASILPFNFPVILFAFKIAPTLIAGNAALVKPPSDNPLTVIRLCEMLVEAGVPDGAIQVVTGQGPRVGKWLCENSGIDAISLTGSSSVGISVMESAAKNLTPVALELGANDAFVVFDDVDVEFAANDAVACRMFDAGQVCCASKRFVVHNSIKDKFIEKVVDKVNNLIVGDPVSPNTQIGCLINEKAAQKVEQQVQKTIDQGAKLLCGGKREGSFYYPTVLADVTPDMDVSKDMEIFGPVMPIIGFDTMEEAIAVVNASIYGLSGSVYTNDFKTAMKMAYELESGSTIINGVSTYRSMEMPFGGYKMSGIGNEGVASTLEEVTQIKNIVMFDVLK